jgi:hypothetical protein
MLMVGNRYEESSKKDGSGRVLYPYLITTYQLSVKLWFETERGVYRSQE